MRFNFCNYISSSYNKRCSKCIQHICCIAHFAHKFFQCSSQMIVLSKLFIKRVSSTIISNWEELFSLKTFAAGKDFEITSFVRTKFVKKCEYKSSILHLYKEY